MNRESTAQWLEYLSMIKGTWSLFPPLLQAHCMVLEKSYLTMPPFPFLPFCCYGYLDYKLFRAGVFSYYVFLHHLSQWSPDLNGDP